MFDHLAEMIAGSQYKQAVGYLAALAKFARHLDICPQSPGRDGQWGTCTCGLDSVREQIEMRFPSSPAAESIPPGPGA